MPCPYPPPENRKEDGAASAGWTRGFSASTRTAATAVATTARAGRRSRESMRGVPPQEGVRSPSAFGGPRGQLRRRRRTTRPEDPDVAAPDQDPWPGLTTDAVRTRGSP